MRSNSLENLVSVTSAKWTQGRGKRLKMGMEAGPRLWGEHIRAAAGAGRMVNSSSA